MQLQRKASEDESQAPIRVLERSCPMVDPDTFLPTLYVMIDDCCHAYVAPEGHPGPPASRSRSEVITLGLCGQWACVRGERAFYRYAHQHLGAAFPSLPQRTPCNRRLRRHHQAMGACVLPRVDGLAGRHGLYEALESAAVPPRDAKRRGAGWLPGLAELGWRNRLGWSEGFHLRMAGHPRGVMTGCGVGPARAKEQPLAETFLARRRPPHPRGLSVGKPALGPYGCEQGFEGQAAHVRGWSCYGAQVLGPPQRQRRHPGSTRVRRWLAGGRQLVEPVSAKVHHTVGLTRERPHALTSLQARVAATRARPNCGSWLNGQRGRPRLACADLVDWYHGAISHQALKSASQ